MISDDINDDTAMENENKFVPFVTCTDSSTDDDANGNTCSSYSNLVSCTDCECDAADNLSDFIVTDSCCSCEGGYGCGREQALVIGQSSVVWPCVVVFAKLLVVPDVSPIV